MPRRRPTTPSRRPRRWRSGSRRLGLERRRDRRAGRARTRPIRSPADSCASVADGPECGTSVWYTFQAPPRAYTIETCDGGTDFSSIVGVYTGALGALTQIALPATTGPQCAGGRTTSAAARSRSTRRPAPSTRSTSPATAAIRAPSTCAPTPGGAQHRPARTPRSSSDSSFVGRHQRGSRPPGDAAARAAAAASRLVSDVAGGDVRMLARRRPVRGLRDARLLRRPGRRARLIRLPGPRGGRRRGRPDARQRSASRSTARRRTRPLSGPSGPLCQPDGDLVPRRARSATTAGLRLRLRQPAVGRLQLIRQTFCQLCAAARTPSTRPAVDMAGNVDPSPATATILVTGGPRLRRRRPSAPPASVTDAKPRRDARCPVRRHGRRRAPARSNTGPPRPTARKSTKASTSRTQPRRNRAATKTKFLAVRT